MYYMYKFKVNAKKKLIISISKRIIYIYLARTPEIGQGLGRILSCGARNPEQT